MFNFFLLYSVYLIGLIFSYGYQIIANNGIAIFESSALSVVYDAKSVVAVSVVCLLYYFVFSSRKETFEKEVDEDILDNPFGERTTMLED